jgi:uracil-DNA glycosylase family 4
MNEDMPKVSPPETSFVPQLDARQRAMLAEMGVRVWAPRPARVALPPALASLAAAEAPLPVREAAAPVAAPVRAARPVPSPVTPAAETSPVPQAPPLKPLPDGVAAMDWRALQAAVGECTACGLCQRRKHAVFGQGDAQADWMVVGDAPNEAEDAQGQPFVGPDGALLDNMLRAVGRSREKGAFVTSVVKCRPPANRNPGGAELAQCSAYLARQVALVQPKVIVAMGRFALEVLTQSRDHLGRLRGREHAFEGVPVIATYGPNALLRTPADKAKAWADLCLAMDVVERHTATPG